MSELIELVETDEELCLEVTADVKIFFRRLQPAEYAAILKACKINDKSEETDYENVVSTTLARGIRHWKGVVSHGSPVPVSIESTAKLPGYLRVKLFQLISLGTPDPKIVFPAGAEYPLENSSGISTAN